MNVCFEKAILTSHYIVGGKPVPFEALSGNHGVLCLDSEKDKVMIKRLDEAIAKGIGGIGRITEAQYENQKKNRPWRPPESKSWLDEPLRINGKKLNPPPPAKRAAAAAVVSPSEDAQGPPDQPDFKTDPGLFRPATRKLGSVAEVASDI